MVEMTFSNRELKVTSVLASSEFNKLIKLEVLEIFDLLTREQFKKYKNLKKNIEKNKIISNGEKAKYNHFVIIFCRFCK